MITLLQLQNFGKFEDKEFHLGKSTIFFGQNEAGKTTIYDAIYSSICNLPLSTKEGKHIAKRYGKKAKSFLSFSDTEMVFSPDEFRSLLSIRAGDSSVYFSESTRALDWTESLKASLFEGGLNPKDLVGVFSKVVSATKPAKTLKELSAEKDKYCEKIRHLTEKKVSLARLEQQGKVLETQIEANESKSRELLNKKDSLESNLALMEKMKEKRKWFEIFSRLKRLDGIKVRLKELESIQPSILMDLEKAAANRLSVIKTMNQTEAALSELRGQVSSLEKTIQLSHTPESKIQSKQGPIHAMLPLGVVLLSIPFVVLLPEMYLKVIALVSGLIAAFGVVLFERTMKRKPTTDDDLPMKSHIRSLNLRIEEIKTTITEKEAQLEELRKRSSHLENSIQSHLQKFGLLSKEDLVKKLEEKRQLSLHLQQGHAEILSTLPEEVDPMSFVEMKLKGFNSIPDDKLDVLRWETIQSDLKKTAHQVDSIRTEISNQREELASIRSRFTTSQEEIPETLLDLETKILKISQKEEEIEIERRAAEIAKEIFETICKDDDFAFSAMASDIALFATPLFNRNLDVQMASLAKHDSTIIDATGAPREIDQLSTGTKSLYEFAMRLALAKRLIEGEAVIVLDDPFLTLDHQRQLNALQTLKGFVAQTGWQTILLTKDAGLKNEFTRIFSGTMVHDLEVNSFELSAELSQRL